MFNYFMCWSLDKESQCFSMVLFLDICDMSLMSYRRHQSAKYKMWGSRVAASFQEIYFMRRLLHSQWVSMAAARQEDQQQGPATECLGSIGNFYCSQMAAIYWWYWYCITEENRKRTSLVHLLLHSWSLDGIPPWDYPEWWLSSQYTWLDWTS